jgi:hypothetical protein
MVPIAVVFEGGDKFSVVHLLASSIPEEVVRPLYRGRTTARKNLSVGSATEHAICGS